MTDIFQVDYVNLVLLKTQDEVDAVNANERKHGYSAKWKLGDHCYLVPYHGERINHGKSTTSSN